MFLNNKTGWMGELLKSLNNNFNSSDGEREKGDTVWNRRKTLTKRKRKERKMLACGVPEKSREFL